MSSVCLIYAKKGKQVICGPPFELEPCNTLLNFSDRHKGEQWKIWETIKNRVMSSYRCPSTKTAKTVCGNTRIFLLCLYGNTTSRESCLKTAASRLALRKRKTLQIGEEGDGRSGTDDKLKGHSLRLLRRSAASRTPALVYWTLPSY